MSRTLAGLGRSVPRNLWTLERFGLSPGKLRYRISDPGAPRVFMVSIPKAGTHLLERALCLHPQLYRKLLPTIDRADVARRGGFDRLMGSIRPGQVVVSHLRFDQTYGDTLRRRGVHGLFLIRDPHDVVVSQVHYVAKRDDHQFHKLFMARADPREKLRLAITGDATHGLPSIGDRLDYFAGWLDSGCRVVRFEDLVGPGGGGSAEAQEAAVASVFRGIGLATDGPLVGSICRRLFSTDSPTFRKGSIGGWRDAFDPELEQLFDEVVGDRAARYGPASEAGPASL